MADLESDVARHYTTGAVTDRILAALEALGVEIASATPQDLKPVDEFHTGGMEATLAPSSNLTSPPTRRCSTSARALAARPVHWSRATAAGWRGST